MILRRPLTPKYERKYSVDLTALKKPIPDTWVEFARLCQIRSGDRLVYFDPYHYQIKLVELLQDHSCIVTKSRQLGITETISNWMLWNAAINPAYLAVILSKSQADTSNIAKRLRRTIDGLSDYIELKTNSVLDIELKSGGRILFRNSSPNGVRGLESVSAILYDEASFVDGIDEIYTASVPSTTMVGDKARLIILSTPNGKQGFYWDKLAGNNDDRNLEKVCEQVRDGSINPLQYWIDEAGWGKFIIHWKAHPIHGKNPNYLQDIQRKYQLSEAKVRQEYDLSFLDSDVSVFSAELVRSNADGYSETQADKQSNYYLGIDTSTLGNDYTVAVVLKQVDNCFYLVDMYRKRKMSSDYNIYHVGELINKFKPEKIAIEVTGGTGQIYLEQLSSEHQGFKFEAIKTTGDSKPAMVERLLLALEKSCFKYPESHPLIEELLNFRRQGKKLEAVTGKHDDLVMACCFAIAISPFKTNDKLFSFDKVATFSI